MCLLHHGSLEPNQALVSSTMQRCLLMRWAKTLSNDWEPGLDKRMTSGQMDLKMSSYPQDRPEAEKEVRWEMARTPRTPATCKTKLPGRDQETADTRDPSNHSCPVCLPFSTHSFSFSLKHLSFNCVAFPGESWPGVPSLQIEYQG